LPAHPAQNSIKNGGMPDFLVRTEDVRLPSARARISRAESRMTGCVGRSARRHIAGGGAEDDTASDGAIAESLVAGLCRG